MDRNSYFGIRAEHYTRSMERTQYYRAANPVPQNEGVPLSKIVWNTAGGGGGGTAHRDINPEGAVGPSGLSPTGVSGGNTGCGAGLPDHGFPGNLNGGQVADQLSAQLILGTLPTVTQINRGLG